VQPNICMYQKSLTLRTEFALPLNGVTNIPHAMTSLPNLSVVFQ